MFLLSLAVAVELLEELMLELMAAVEEQAVD
jgi:hypothetical protein